MAQRSQAARHVREAVAAAEAEDDAGEATQAPAPEQAAEAPQVDADAQTDESEED